MLLVPPNFPKMTYLENEMTLRGSPKALRGGVEQRTIQKAIKRRTSRCWGTDLGPGLERKLSGEHLVAWLAHGARLGAAEEITWNYLPAGLPPAGKGIRIGCVASQLAGNDRKLSMLTPGRADWFQGCGT